MMCQQLARLRYISPNSRFFAIPFEVGHKREFSGVFGGPGEKTIILLVIDIVLLAHLVGVRQQMGYNCAPSLGGFFSLCDSWTICIYLVPRRSSPTSEG